MQRCLMHAARVIEMSRSRSAKDKLRDRIPKRVIVGTLVDLPQIGLSMIVFQRDKVTRLITSEVIRVLTDCDGTLYAETLNSVYRIDLASPKGAPSNQGSSTPSLLRFVSDERM